MGFKFSPHWLWKFKKSHQIRKLKLYVEAEDVDPVLMHQSKELVRGWLNECQPRRVFGMDETGRFYSLVPSFSVVTAEEAGVKDIKKVKDRLALAVCTDMDGSHRMQPFAIEKSANPRWTLNMDVAAFCDYR